MESHAARNAKHTSHLPPHQYPLWRLLVDLRATDEAFDGFGPGLLSAHNALPEVYKLEQRRAGVHLDGHLKQSVPRVGTVAIGFIVLLLGPPGFLARCRFSGCGLSSWTCRLGLFWLCKWLDRALRYLIRWQCWCAIILCCDFYIVLDVYRVGWSNTVRLDIDGVGGDGGASLGRAQRPLGFVVAVLVLDWLRGDVRLVRA